jgi:hypothetical protein
MLESCQLKAHESSLQDQVQNQDLSTFCSAGTPAQSDISTHTDGHIHTFILVRALSLSLSLSLCLSLFLSLSLSLSLSFSLSPSVCLSLLRVQAVCT